MAQTKSGGKVVKVVTSGVKTIYPDVHIYDTALAHIEEDHASAFLVLNDIYRTIEDPEFVQVSTTRPDNSFVLTNTESTDHKGRALRVIVKTDQYGNGILSTALHAKMNQKGAVLHKREKKK